MTVVHLVVCHGDLGDADAEEGGGEARVDHFAADLTLHQHLGLIQKTEKKKINVVFAF